MHIHMHIDGNQVNAKGAAVVVSALDAFRDEAALVENGAAALAGALGACCMCVACMLHVCCHLQAF